MNIKMNTTTKTCSGCKETRPLSSFYKDRARADGLQYRCKLCQRESNRRYCGQNRAAERERNRQYHAANPQVAGTTSALKRSPLPESELFAGASRSQVNAEVRFDYILRDLLTEKTGITHHIDHIKPLCEGGVHRMWNLSVVTEERNKAKGPIWFCEDHLTDEDIEAQDEATLAFVPAE